MKNDQLNDAQAMEFHDLPNDNDKKQIKSFMLEGQTFQEARGTLTGLAPDQPIRALHSRCIEKKGLCLLQIGDFAHAVAHGAEGRADLIERLSR